MIAGDRHAGSKLEKALETRAPIAANGKVDAHCAELFGGKRQDDVDFTVGLEHSFEYEDIGATGGRAVHRSGRELGHSSDYLIPDRRLQRGGKPWSGPGTVVDEVAGADQYRWNP